MNTLSPNSAASRRQFLRDGLRLAMLGGLAAAGGTLAGRQAGLPAGQVCVSAGICRGCAVYEDCELPRALSVKEAIGQSKTRPL
jgi:hypothetical protein